MTVTDKYNQRLTEIRKSILRQLGDDAEQYELFCKFMQAYEREKVLRDFAFKELLKEEQDAKREKAESKVPADSYSGT